MDEDRIKQLSVDFEVSVNIVYYIVDLYGEDDMKTIRYQLNKISLDYLTDHETWGRVCPTWHRPGSNKHVKDTD